MEMGKNGISEVRICYLWFLFIFNYCFLLLDFIKLLINDVNWLDKGIWDLRF